MRQLVLCPPGVRWILSSPAHSVAASPLGTFYASSGSSDLHGRRQLRVGTIGGASAMSISHSNLSRTCAFVSWGSSGE